MSRPKKHLYQALAGALPLALALASVTAGTVRAQTPSPGEGDAADDTPAEREPIQVAPIDVGAVRSGGDGGVARLVSDSERAPNAERGLEDAAFVTVVRIDERAGETASVAEVLAETMGASVRSLGGLGSFSSISVRGAAGGQTSVSIDGVPLSRVAGATADLGRLALDSFSQVELYRGAVPVALGASALGGALNLVTPVGRPDPGDALVLSAGGGSFATRHLSARWLGSPTRDTGLHLSLGYQGTGGDFSYFDDKGTNLDPSDDEFVERHNNQHDQLEWTARFEHTRGDVTLTGGARGFARRQGLPGRGSAQSTAATADVLAQIVDARARLQRLFGSPRLVGEASAYSSFEWQHYEDRLGEVRLGVQDAKQWWLSSGGAARVVVDLGEAQLLTVGLDTRLELAALSDILETAGQPEQPGQPGTTGWRAGAAVAVTDEITLGQDERISLAPAVRLDGLYTVPMDDANQPVVGEGELAPRTDVFFSPRLAARARVFSGLALKASVGSYMREPTVPELFGGRGVHVGNPSLLVEHGVSGDLGFVLAPGCSFAEHAGRIDRVYLESAAFYRRPRDTIVYRTTLGGSFNLGDATMYGVEAAASARLSRTVTASVNYTWVRTRQDSPLPSYDGKPLPYAPAHELFTRLDAARRVRGRLAVVWADVAYASGNHLDLAGLSVAPARRLFGAGIKLELGGRASLGFEAKNLTDERVQYVTYDPPPSPDLTRSPRALADFYGYPLPGRALYLTLDWKGTP